MTCEWPTQSRWNSTQCGRPAPENLYGPSLCWQHRDKAIEYVLEELRENRLSKATVDDLATALIDLNRLRIRKGNEYHGYQDAIDREMVRRLNEGDLTEGMHDAVDDLITARLHQQWGAA